MAENIEWVENKIRDIFKQCLAFNKTIIPHSLIGYELMITDLVLRNVFTGLIKNLQATVSCVVL